MNTQHASAENVRKTALSVLNRCIGSGDGAEQYSNLALDQALKRSTLCPEDRALLTVLVYGVLERLLTLDDWIRRLSSRKSEELSPEIRNLLRLGLYQLAYLERVPDHAAVHETVELTPKAAKGFVNAILREFCRRGKSLPLPEESHLPQFLSVKYSVSPELCERLTVLYGRERAEAVLYAFSRVPSVCLRINTLKTDRASLLSLLRNAGACAEPTAMSRTGILVSGMPVTSLPGFSDGLFFVQDESSQLCVESMDAHAGMRVLDLCACPGSKSFGAALEMGNTGVVFSCDLHANKLPLIENGAARLGIGILHTFAGDARVTRPEWVGTMDRVLCDVPCSGFGVLAKKPELRYKSLASCRPLPDIQFAIVCVGASYVRPGGKLIYSTCTVLPEENGENVRRLLDMHPEFSLESERQLLPDADGTDGFYFAVLKKKG